MFQSFKALNCVFHNHNNNDNTNMNNNNNNKNRIEDTYYLFNESGWIHELCTFSLRVFQIRLNFFFTQATEANLNVNGIQASTTSTLNIHIDDLNDKPPLFYKCEGDIEVCIETRDFSGEVDEHASVGLSITGLNMRVKDADAVRWSTFSVMLDHVPVIHNIYSFQFNP